MSALNGTDRPLPDRVVHADWSKHPARRWLARAEAVVRIEGWIFGQPAP